MSETQKIIKYFGVALAVLLIFSIISGIMSTLSFLVGFSKDKDDKTERFLNAYEEVKALKIEVISSNIIIKNSPIFKVESSSKYIEYQQQGSTLNIKEKKLKSFNKAYDLIIYLPDDKLEQVVIENGAGQVKIEKLITNNLNLNLGAGKATINQLVVSNNTKINSGAGEVIITDGNLNNLDLDMGVGKVTITTKLTGDNKIDHGIGAFELNLIGSSKDYRFEIDKGLGEVIAFGQNIKDDTTLGEGSNLVEIDSGIGQVMVNLKEDLE